MSCLPTYAPTAHITWPYVTKETRICDVGLGADGEATVLAGLLSIVRVSCVAEACHNNSVIADQGEG
jgi:hypothetical protein